MGGRVNSIETVNENAGELSHHRILWLMMYVTVLGGVLGLIFNSPVFALGIVIGGFLSFINYYWLKFSLRKVFDGALEGKKPSVFGAQYILRYLTFGLLLALIYLTKMLPMMAILLGLSSFAFAIVIEGILRIFSSFNNKKEI